MTGQTIDGHPIYIPDGLYALETGDYVSGLSTDIAITTISSATNLADFYINSDPTASTSVPLGKSDLILVLEHDLGHGLGFINLIERSAAQAGSPPIADGAAANPYDMLVSYGTMAGDARA